MGYGNGGNYGSDTAPMSGMIGPQAAREPLIAREASRTDGQIEALHSLISELETRLGPVLMPEPPASSANPGTAVPTPTVPLAQVMASQGMRLVHACARLQSIANRIEV